MVRPAAVALALILACDLGQAISFPTTDPLPPHASFVLQWGKAGPGAGEFDFPIGIALTAADEVLITDHYNRRVQKFSSKGKYLAEFATAPGPGGIAVNAQGEIFIAHFGAIRGFKERQADQITVHSPEGKLLRAWGKTGAGPGEFDMPGGLAIDKAGQVHVADQTNRRVQVFDSQGKLLRQWGEYGIKPGQFGGNVSRPSRVGGPQFLALDSEGHVFTTEGSLGRVQKFSADGKPLLAWGDNQDRPGSFGGKFMPGVNLQGPIALCLDKEGMLWVSAVSGRVQRFNPEGKHLGGFGQPGGKPSEFLAPHGIACDRQGNLYVVDAFNHRVQKFAITK